MSVACCPFCNLLEEDRRWLHAVYEAYERRVGQHGTLQVKKHPGSPPQLFVLRSEQIPYRGKSVGDLRS